LKEAMVGDPGRGEIPSYKNVTGGNKKKQIRKRIGE